MPSRHDVESDFGTHPNASPGSARTPRSSSRFVQPSSAAVGLRTKLLTLALLAAMTAATVGTWSSRPLSPQDEGQLLVYPDMILRGYLPYRDFAAAYGPATYYSVAAAFKAFGSSVLTERMVGMCYRFLIVTSCFLIGIRFSWVIGFTAAVVSLLMQIWFRWPGAYSMFGSLALALLALFSATESADPARARRCHSWAALAGILGGFACWFRLEVGLIGTLAAFIALEPRQLRRVALFACGWILPGCAAAVFVLAVGPAAIFDSLILDPVRTGPDRILPIRPTPDLIALIACTVATLIVAIAIRDPMCLRQSAWLARGIAVFSLGLLPLALQRADGWHTTYVSTAVAGLAVISLGALLARSAKDISSRRLRIAVCVVASLVVLGADELGRRSISDLPATEISFGGRTVPAMFWPGKGSPEDLSRLLIDVGRATQPHEMLFVGLSDLRYAVYNDTFLYYLLPHLRPASRYLELNPGVPNREDSGLAQEIASADWLILTTRYDSWREPAARSTLPNEVVRRLFCLRGEYGPWQLLQRCTD